MLNANTWFDIPVNDLAAARRFYEALLARPMGAVQEMGGDTMAVFAHDQGAAGGALVQRADCKPGANGTVVYLDSAPSVQAALDRGVAAGAAVVVPRTLIAPGIGYFALVKDPDGNVVGLHAAD